MARLNGKGPENKGLVTGRSLGNCSKSLEVTFSEKYQLGQGMGKRRKAGFIENENTDNN